MWAGGRGGTLCAMPARFAIACGRKAGQRRISRTPRMLAAITASGHGRGASERCWSFCTLRFSFVGGMSLDSLGRPLRDLRISVTDRCNFRCTYCMPREIYGRDFEFLRRDELMSFEEIAHLAQLFAQLGTEKIR